MDCLENPDGLERRVCPIHDEVYINTCFGCVADQHRSELAMYDPDDETIEATSSDINDWQEAHDRLMLADQAHQDNTATPKEIIS